MDTISDWKRAFFAALSGKAHSGVTAQLVVNDAAQIADAAEARIREREAQADLDVQARSYAEQFKRGLVPLEVPSAVAQAVSALLSAQGTLHTTRTTASGAVSFHLA